MLPYEGESRYLIATLSVLLLQAIGAEEDKEYDSVMPKEGKEL